MYTSELASGAILKFIRGLALQLVTVIRQEQQPIQNVVKMPQFILIYLLFQKSLPKCMHHLSHLCISCLFRGLWFQTKHVLRNPRLFLCTHSRLKVIQFIFDMQCFHPWFWSLYVWTHDTHGRGRSTFTTTSPCRALTFVPKIMWGISTIVQPTIVHFIVPSRGRSYTFHNVFGTHVKLTLL